MHAARRHTPIEPAAEFFTFTGGASRLGRAFGLMVHGASEYNIGAIAYEASTTILGVVSIRLIARSADTAPANP